MRAGWRSRSAVAPAAFLVSLCCEPAALAGQAQPLPPAIAATSESGRDSPTHLVMTVGKSLIVDNDIPVQRIAVGYGDIAEALAVSPREVLLNAKAPGVTSLIVWREGGSRKVFDITVVASRVLAESRTGLVEREIDRELPGQNVSLSFENDTVFLRGRVKNLTSADRAMAIASTLGKTVSLLYVDVPPPEMQILLKVKFASVDRNIATQLGMNIVSTGATNTVGSISTQQFSPPGFSTLQSGTPAVATLADALNLFFFRSDLNLGATIQALETKGLLQVLSEPNVLAENGKQASFLAGGEFPFPSVSAGTGGTPIVSILFREFGVRLTFTPTITSRGTIHLQVAPEVSALDFTNGLSISGFNVPALTTRKLNTQVELNEGQSFAIGGLLDNRTTDTLEKIPFIGDIPILGKLFRSKSIQKQNTELIVIVTPELVRPIPAGRPLPQLKYPTAFLKPNTAADMHTPELAVTGPVPVTPVHEAIPMEELVRSLQPVTSPVQPSVPAAGSTTNSTGVPPQ